MSNAEKNRTPFQNFGHVLFAVPTHGHIRQNLVVLGACLLLVLDEPLLPGEGTLEEYSGTGILMGSRWSSYLADISKGRPCQSCKTDTVGLAAVCLHLSIHHGAIVGHLASHPSWTHTNDGALPSKHSLPESFRLFHT